MGDHRWRAVVGIFIALVLKVLMVSARQAAADAVWLTFD